MTARRGQERARKDGKRKMTATSAVAAGRAEQTSHKQAGPLAQIGPFITMFPTVTFC